MSAADSDRVVVSDASAAGAWTATIDFDRSEVVVIGSARAGTHAIRPDDLAALRACAEAAFARGDRTVHDQFADGETTFELHFGGGKVQLRFLTDGGTWCEGVQPIWEFVRGGW